ncbi:MAG TPA: ABC transporter substrate-binding protein, partial [Ktedonobacteraceae bacterium]|nr:ABC transporter substrate-binding protein [Ktedonobacteraceae bacterium]
MHFPIWHRSHSRQPRFKRTLALLLLIGSLMGLAACGPASSQSTSSGKPNVTIGYMDNGAEPEVIAVAQSLFGKYMNANVQVKYFDSGPASLGAVASGALQFMTGIGNPPTVSAITRGVPLQIVWAQELYTSDEGLVVRSTSSIHSVKDLVGKTVALVLGSTSEFALDATLKKAGIDPTTVHKLNMAPPAMHAAWTNHSIDAAFVWDPVLDALVHDGGKLLGTDQDVKQQAPIYSLSLVNSSWGTNHPDLVKGFIQAQNAAVTFYQQHPEEALQVIAKQDSISVETAKTEMAGYQIFDLHDQLSADALGQGSSIGSSLVAQSLALAGQFLQQKGALSSVPSSFTT